MNSLTPCPSCGRHVRSGGVTCPFCEVTLLSRPMPLRPATGARLSRAALFTASAALAGIAACSSTTTVTDGGGGTGGGGGAASATGGTGGATGGTGGTGGAGGNGGASSPTDAAIDRVSIPIYSAPFLPQG